MKRKKSADPDPVGTIAALVFGLAFALATLNGLAILIDTTITRYQLNTNHALTTGRVISRTGYRARTVVYSFSAPGAHGAAAVFQDEMFVGKSKSTAYAAGMDVRVAYVPGNPSRSALRVMSLPQLMTSIGSQILVLLFLGGVTFVLLWVVWPDIRSFWQRLRGRRSPAATP